MYSKFGIFVFLFLSYYIVNISSKETPIDIDLISDISTEDFKPLYFKSNDLELIPSLFSPLTLFKYKEDRYTDVIKMRYSMTVGYPLFNDDYTYDIHESSFLNKKINILLGIEKSSANAQNYFGLSYGLPKFNKDEKLYNTLEYLKNTSQIEEKVFSFSKWSIGQNQVKSRLYLGYKHEDFDGTNKKYIGTCKVFENKEAYWGCKFNNMIFNNQEIKLDSSEVEDDAVYFSSEKNIMTLPKKFKEIIEKASNNDCTFSRKKEFYLASCKTLFTGESIPLTLSNEYMDITFELDSLTRFSHNTNLNKGEFRVNFSDKTKYIIFPLMMFKNFHIQFNADTKQIYFYSEDENILHIKKESVVETKSSNVGKVFLIIFLIIVIIAVLLAIAYGVYYFIKHKRRGGVEQEIGKFSKIEMTGKSD